MEPVFSEVEILECNPLPDGRFYLEIQGKRRLRLVSTSDLDGYRIARATPFGDDPQQQQQQGGAEAGGPEVSGGWVGRGRRGREDQG